MILLEIHDFDTLKLFFELLKEPTNADWSLEVKPVFDKGYLHYIVELD